MLDRQISGFIAYCKVSGFKDKSIESLSLRLGQFNRFVNEFHIKRIDLIQYRHLRQFVADYRQPSIHVKKARIWSLRQFYHYLVLNNQVTENIAADLVYPKIEKTVPEFLTADEYNRILEHCFLYADTDTGLRNLIIVMLLGMLGLRTNAVIGLNMQDVHLPAGLMWIREKGGIARSIVLPKVMCRFIQTYLADRNYQRGPLLLSRLSPRSLQDIFARIADAVGIDKHLHAHLFRHTAGTHLNKIAGSGICQYVLGHARHSNSARYTHLNPDHYAGYMRCHPFIKEAL